MQKEERKAVNALLQRERALNGEFTVVYETVSQRFPELTISYIKERDTTYILLWKRYVFGEYKGDQRVPMKKEIQKNILSWVLRAANFAAYKIYEDQNKKVEENGK